MKGNPLREPQPQRMGPAVQKVELTLKVTLGTGEEATYEFHNIGFALEKVAPLFGEPSHGVDLKVWKPSEHDPDHFPSLGAGRRLIATEPDEIDLHVRGTLRPRAEDEHFTYTVTKEPTP